MKQILLLSLLAGLSLTATAQSAQDTSVYIRGYDAPAKTYPVYLTNFDRYKGAYDLSNGEVLSLRQHGRQMFATVGDRPEKELVAISRNVFVLKDKGLKMALRRDDGEVKGEVLLREPSMALGQAGNGAGHLRMAVGR
ncbi:hypothetical protein [Massilia glaciei]|uniref:DUF2846 domain-containing protein n=1 Tax=Massilia glaciei TaxID=1524097 RepID=A0A2U2HMR6_9BURK|nr:hypothetical protein [Massilia glaciei]PWF48800.1 hypothetical protein C7C56_010015 [Massilia glaciei]